MTQLIVFRAIQGLGAGGMMTNVQAIIGDLFPPADRGKWQGLIMAVFGLSSIVGPVSGGWITDNWGWKWIFYVNMPIGALAILTAGVALPSRSRKSQHQVDYHGAALLVAAAVPTLLAFSWGGSQFAWASVQITGLIAFALAMWVAFVVAESRSPEPIISLALFRNRVFAVSVVATFLASGGMFGAIMFVPLFMQGVVGESATNAGAVLTPMMLGFVVSSVVSGQIMSRSGRYKALAIAGFAGGTVGMFLLARMDQTTTSASVVQNMVLTGLGIGVGMSLFTIVVQNALPDSALGQVTASLQFFRSIGSTIGVALLGTAMNNRFQSELTARLPSGIAQVLPPGASGFVENPQALLNPEATTRLQQYFVAAGPQGQLLFDQFLGAMRASLSGAITTVFAVGCALMVLGLVATLFLPEIPLRQRRRASPVEVANAPPAVVERTTGATGAVDKRLS
jgi:EmrB/QacA subfamily drug resistance transporter